VKKQGLRVTDDATLSVVKTVLDEVNGQLVAELRSHGLNAVGFPSSSVLLTAKKLILTDAQCEPVDLGHVGSIIAVDAGALALALQQGQVPVVAPIGSDASGNYYNVNADEVASSVATFVKAGSLVFLSDVPGVLSTNGSSSIVPLISADDCQALIADGTVKGGMIPKLTTALQAASKGVSYVQIIDGREQGALFKAFTQPGANGTVIAG
jgi:acetylglutamate kinase